MERVILNSRPRLLLLAATTGYQTRMFADRALTIGYDLTLATDRCHVLDDPWGDHAIPVKFESPEESAAVLAAAGPFDGIVAVADRPGLIAAMTAARLGMCYNSVDSMEACRNKHLARSLLAASRLQVPTNFRTLISEGPAHAARRARYPCVLKPLGLSASQGVIRANNPCEFQTAFCRIEAILAAPEIRRLGEGQHRYVQVEDFIPGKEYAVEGVLTGGRLQVLAIFDKPDPLNGPFFEETIYVTPSRTQEQTQASLISTTRGAIDALGLTEGSVHAELRHNEYGSWVLEVAARPIGGLCAKALSFNGGMPLEELTIRHAVGEDVSAATLDGPASGVMMIPIPRAGIYEGVRGVTEDVIITAKQGQKLVPLPEGSSYLGFIFARGTTPEEVEGSLRAAHAKLSFDIVEALPVL